MSDKIKNDVLKAIDKIRPFLQKDDGDIELVDITDDKKVKVKFLGNCENCRMSNMTFEAGVKKTIMTEVREVSDVEIV